ncbi:hypothetical protein ruthe_01726 [Rubellimicrobium thermophilum DSM 16684]|uniref:Uncharacterized protein n=1 Tax=Rubellimicrobium thermophilum DSM 16684 TaxID=1123069 RepID=S9QVL7_9RHOB|nr:hypothetical protein ruthe_01726 [Rubellimicrobium thermophilum DSM 16684]
MPRLANMRFSRRVFGHSLEPVAFVASLLQRLHLAHHGHIHAAIPGTLSPSGSNQWRLDGSM